MFQKLQRRLVLSLIVVASVSLTACNSKRKLVPVSGRVTIDGKPLETGSVMVWAKDYRAAVGVIGKDGRFSLMTHAPGDGCVLGEHTMTVSSRVTIKETYVKYFIPKRYEDPTLSKLKINVTKPEDDLRIELTWAGDPHKGPYQE